LNEIPLEMLVMTCDRRVRVAIERDSLSELFYHHFHELLQRIDSHYKEKHRKTALQSLPFEMIKTRRFIYAYYLSTEENKRYITCYNIFTSRNKRSNAQLLLTNLSVLIINNLREMLGKASLKMGSLSKEISQVVKDYYQEVNAERSNLYPPHYYPFQEYLEEIFDQKLDEETVDFLFSIEKGYLKEFTNIRKHKFTELDEWWAANFLNWHVNVKGLALQYTILWDVLSYNWFAYIGTKRCTPKAREKIRKWTLDRINDHYQPFIKQLELSDEQKDQYLILISHLNNYLAANNLKYSLEEFDLPRLKNFLLWMQEGKIARSNDVIKSFFSFCWLMKGKKVSLPIKPFELINFIDKPRGRQQFYFHYTNIEPVMRKLSEKAHSLHNIEPITFYNYRIRDIPVLLRQNVDYFDITEPLYQDIHVVMQRIEKSGIVDVETFLMCINNQGEKTKWINTWNTTKKFIDTLVERLKRFFPRNYSLKQLAKDHYPLPKRDHERFRDHGIKKVSTSTIPDFSILFHGIFF